MKDRKRQWIIDFFTILAMMTTVILLCHPIGREWTEEEINRYVGTDGDYSPDVDTYYYLRKAKEFTENGIGSITLVVNRAEDKMCTTGEAIAREANGSMPMLLPASAALTWYGLRAIGIDVSVYDVTIRFCSFLLSLFVIPIYLFLKRRTSWIAAVLGAFLGSLEVPFFRHSHVGFFDTDAMIGLLALILVLSLFESFVQKARKQQIIFGMASLVALVLLRFAWTAFFIYGVIAVGTVMLGLIAVRLCGKYTKEQRKAFFVPGIAVLAIFASSLVLGWNAFISLAKGFVSSPISGDWPSETLNIEELGRVPLSDAQSLWFHFGGFGRDVTSVTGGALALLLLIISTFVCIFRLIQLIRRRTGVIEEVFLLSSILTWLFGAVFLAFFGIRYMEFVTLPSSIVTGLGFDRIGQFCTTRTIEGKRGLFAFAGIFAFCGLVLEFQIVAVVVSALIFGAGWVLSKQRNATALITTLAIVVLTPVGASCVVVCAKETPYVERPIEEAMIWVKENTPKDAVLADFWNLAYTYQYYGERRTLADGGTYNGQFFYWLANMLVAKDSNLSVGIAQMLQNCGIDGSEYAESLTGSAEDARVLLKKILPQSRLNAEEMLKSDYSFTEGEMLKLLNFTHPIESPEIFFVASHDTFNLISMLMLYQKWGVEDEDTKGETYYSVSRVLSPRENETVFSRLVLGAEPSVSGQVAIEALEGELVGWIVTRDGEMIPCEREIYFRDGEVVYDRTIELSEGPGDEEALLLFEEDGMVSVVLLEKGAADSTFINLFLMDGANQESFEKVYDSANGEGIQDRISDNASISIWRINTER